MGAEFQLMKESIARSVRVRSASHIVDLSGVTPGEAAIYTLADLGISSAYGT